MGSKIHINPYAPKIAMLILRTAFHILYIFLVELRWFLSNALRISTAHDFCVNSARTEARARAKTWRIFLDIELCQLKNGYSAPTGMGTPNFFLAIVINLS